MEKLSLEEKIATFKKKIEELDPQAAAASGGDSSDSPEVEKAFQKEFEKGKIAAMKNRLVRKGLSVEGGGPDAVAAAEDEMEEERKPSELSDAEKAARIAAEFEKGKIAAMKNRLASKGLDLDAATTATETAVDASKDDKEGAMEEKAAEPSADSNDMPVKGSQQETDATTDKVGAVETTAGDIIADGVVAPVASFYDGDNAVKEKSAETSPEPNDTPTEKEAEYTEGDRSANDVGKPLLETADVEIINVDNTIAESAEQKDESPPVNGQISNAIDVTNETSGGKDESPPVVPAEVSEFSEEESADAPPLAVTGGGISGEEEPQLKVDDYPEPAPNVVIDASPVPKPQQNGDASPAVTPAATAEVTDTPVTDADLKSEGGTLERAAAPSTENEGSEAPSKAKAALATSRVRTITTTQGSARRQQGQRRQTVASAKPNMTQARRPSSPARASVRRRLSEPDEARGVVSPPEGSVSRPAPVNPFTPGVHASSTAPSSGSSTQRRRSRTPVRQRPSPSSQQQQAAAAPIALRMTPAAAAESGNRLHEQGRQIRERLERRRTMGATSASAPTGTPSPVTPTMTVMTPTSAERSGNRLHEQARETRQRLERRRKEMVASPLSPFTPRRWSNPRMGNPSVAGMERVESLYRDAVHRNSKLEIARRAAERPSECTFTPEISRRAASRGRGEKRGSRGEDGDISVPDNMSTFHDLYLDAKRRREKMEARSGDRLKEAVGRASPEITERGRQSSVVPLEVRMKENAERWARRWKELEARKLELEKEGCTFMPNFNIGRSVSAPRMRPRRDGGGGGGITSFVARSLRFQAERERKMEKLKQEALERERIEATFRPKLTSLKAGDDSGTSNIDVFERLLKAATEQEMNRAALKEQLWKQELEKYHGFQVGCCYRVISRIFQNVQIWIQFGLELTGRPRTISMG